MQTLLPVKQELCEMLMTIDTHRHELSEIVRDELLFHLEQVAALLNLSDILEVVQCASN